MAFKSRDGMAVPDIQTWRQHLLATQAQTFKRVFGVEMSECYSVTSGLNLRSLGITSKPYSALWYKEIQTTFGDAGVALVEVIMTHPKKTDVASIVAARGQAPVVPAKRTSAGPTAISFASAFSEAPAPEPPAPQATSGNGFSSLFSEGEAAQEEPEVEAQENEVAEDETPQPSGFGSLFT